MELHQRERYHIENNDCVYKVIPTRTHNEFDRKYKKENRELLNEKQIIYNKSHFLEKAEYDIIYRLKNNDKIKEKNAELYECECGSISRQHHYLRHNLTLKHVNFINNQTVM